MIALLAAHSGAHAASHAAPIAALPLIFRRAVAAVRRKLAAPEGSPVPSGAVTVLLADAVPVPEPEHNERTLTSAEIAALTPASAVAHADAVHAMSARFLPAAPRPVNGRNLGTLPRRHPGATLPRTEPLVDRGPGKPPWMTAAHAVYRNGWQ